MKKKQSPGAILNAMRKRHGGGRPRSNAERCRCDVMTLKRAIARGRSREHKQGCTFYQA